MCHSDFSSCFWAGNSLLKKVSFCFIQMLFKVSYFLIIFFNGDVLFVLLAAFKTELQKKRHLE